MPPAPTMKVQRVKIDSLLSHPNNPRQGDVDAIVDSLSVHGQYRPIIVQKSTRYILAGNHTTKAAAKLGWDTIEAVILDVDDAQATKILLADNRTADLGGYDNDQLVELLSGLGADLAGTGYSNEALDDLIADTTRKPAETPDSSWDDRNTTIATTIVWDDAGQQQIWNGWLAHLKQTQDGDTHAARITAYLGTLEQ